MKKRMRILLLEDDPLDAELISHALAGAGPEPHIERVDTKDAFLAALSPDLDVILVDLNIPQFDGLEALEAVRRSKANVPVLLISGIDSEQLATTAFENNAAGYMSKDHLERLRPAIREALKSRNSHEGQQGTESTLAEER